MVTMVATEVTSFGTGTILKPIQLSPSLIILLLLEMVLLLHVNNLTLRIGKLKLTNQLVRENPTLMPAPETTQDAGRLRQRCNKQST